MRYDVWVLNLDGTQYNLATEDALPWDEAQALVKTYEARGREAFATEGA